MQWDPKTMEIKTTSRLKSCGVHKPFHFKVDFPAPRLITVQIEH